METSVETIKLEMVAMLDLALKDHEPGKKIVLGKEYKKGKKSLKLAIKDLVNHPATKEFYCNKTL